MSLSKTIKIDFANARPRPEPWTDAEKYQIQLLSQSLKQQGMELTVRAQRGDSGHREYVFYSQMEGRDIAVLRFFKDAKPFPKYHVKIPVLPSLLFPFYLQHDDIDWVASRTYSHVKSWHDTVSVPNPVMSSKGQVPVIS